jgi:hypothetical protein
MFNKVPRRVLTVRQKPPPTCTLLASDPFKFNKQKQPFNQLKKTALKRPLASSPPLSRPSPQRPAALPHPHKSTPPNPNPPSPPQTIPQLLIKTINHKLCE